MLKRVGFFRELEPGGDRAEAGSIFDAVRPTGEPDEAKIVDYLRSGHMIIPVMEGAPDVITNEYGHPEASGCSSWISDGTWVWRQDLSHYVGVHHVSLPHNFLAHVRANRYVMPELSEERFAQLSRQLGEVWGR